jgi:5-methylcytosine-specific restriction endonuclease McrA
VIIEPRELLGFVFTRMNKCFECGVLFKDWRKNRTRCFCSKECYLKNHSNGYLKNRTITERKCIVCKEIFIPNYKSRVCCSMSCASKKTRFQIGHSCSEEIREKISKTKLKNTKYKTVEEKCKCCGELFRFRNYKRRVFCSRKCVFTLGSRRGVSLSKEKRLELSLKMKGCNNYGWKGGISIGENKKKYQRFSSRLRKSRLKGAVGRFSFMDWENLKTKYNHTCLCCGKKEPTISLTVDHIIPISRGGDNYITNIQPLCLSCNKKKHTKTKDYR